MTAITAAVTRRTRNLAAKSVGDYPITTAVTVVVGELVNFVVSATAPARVRAATAAASRVFAGIVESTSTDAGTGNTAGTVTARVAWGHEVRIACATALTTAYVTCNAAIADNNTATTASAAGTAGVQVIIGEVTEKESVNVAWVHLRKNAAAGNV